MCAMTTPRRVILVLIAFLLPALAAARATPAGGADLAALRAAAEKGDARSQLALAKALGGPSRAEARAWAQKSAGQGLAEAWFWLGYTALQNEQPAAYYEKAAEMGYPEAFPYLLDRLLFRAGPSADVVKAKKFADLARKLGIDLGWSAAAELATIDSCFEAGAPKIPAADRPSAGEVASFRHAAANCRDWTGAGARPADWARVRKCLLAAPEADNNALAEIYANGWGVQRDPRLAIALVCHGSEVPAELFDMVKTLDATRGQAKLEKEFRFCDHVTSGMNMGRCAAQDEDLAAQKREAALAALTAGWSPRQKEALAELRQAAEAFFVERSRSEQDMGGTARIGIAVAEQATLRDDLLKALEGFEHGALPADAGFAPADLELNRVWSQLMKAKRKGQLGTVTPEGIRATQQKWLAYRDAWARLGAARYPSAPAEAWKTWATMKRVAQLKEISRNW
jgi:uncharacterized protein YecT (DUF1311 family)